MRNAFLGSLLFAVLTFLAAGLLRIGWLAWQWDTAYAGIPDSYYYFCGAANLAEGKGYVDNSGKPIINWPVGYPAVLAACFAATGPRIGTIYVVNAVLSWASTVMVWLLALRCSRSKRVANIVAVIVVGVLWEEVFSTTLVQSEVLYLFVVLAGFLVMTAPASRTIVNSVLTGLVFGLGCLIRPEAVLIPGVYLFSDALLNREREWRQAVRSLIVVYAIVAIIAVPWSLRTSRIVGRFSFISSAGEYAFFHANYPDANGQPGGYGLARKIVPKGMTPTAYTWRYILEHPSHYFELIPRKLAAMFLPHGGIAPTDAHRIQMLPESGITPWEYERVCGEKNPGHPVRKAWMAERFVFDERRSVYVPRTGLSDMEKSTFVHYLLLYGFDFPTPPGFVYLRTLYRMSRYLITGLLLGLGVWLVLSRRSRAGWWARRPLGALTITAVVMVLPYVLIYSGCNRYAYPILPFLSIPLGYAIVHATRRVQPAGDRESVT